MEASRVDLKACLALTNTALFSSGGIGFWQTSQIGTRANLEKPQVDGQHGAHANARYYYKHVQARNSHHVSHESVYSAL